MDHEAPAPSWAGVVGSAWALAYVPIHLYWAATGDAWPIDGLPEGLTEPRWRQANWGATVVITGAAAVSLALVHPWGRRLPRSLLLGVAGVGAVFALLHWAAFSAATALTMAGVTDGEVTSFSRWNLFVFEPWFLGMGLLLAVAASQHARSTRGAAGSEHGTPRRGTRASAALVLGGSLVVLVGVMTFQFWIFAVVGPALIGLGGLGRLLARRAPQPA